MTAISAGQTSFFSIPVGQVAQISGNGIAVLMNPVSSPISINGSGILGPFGFLRIVSLGAISDLDYTVGPPPANSVGVGSGGGAAPAISFSTTIPLAGTSTMAKQTVTGPIAFAPADGAVPGASCIAVLVANGTNTPTFTGGFAAADAEWGSSLGYVNTAGYTNVIQFWYDGAGYRYSISQPATQVIAAAPSTGISMSGPTTGVTGVASSNFTLAFTPGGSTAPAVVITPSDGGAGGTFNPASRTTAGTFTYTPSGTGARTISVTNNAGLTNPSNITYTVTAALAAPGAPSLVATAGVASASIAITAGSGGAASGYTVTSNPAGGVDSAAGTTTSPRTITGLTGGTAYTFTATATNGTGTSAASAASNSVTPTAATGGGTAGDVARMSVLSATTVETGDATAGWNYTGTGTGFVNGGVSSTALAAGTDGSVSATINTPAGIGMVGFRTVLPASVPANDYSNYAAGIYADVGGTNLYKVVVGGTVVVATTARAPVAGDKQRVHRVGTSFLYEVSSDGGTTWNTIHTSTSASQLALYPSIIVTNATNSMVKDVRLFSGA